MRSIALGLLVSSLLFSPILVPAQMLPASPHGDMPCDRILSEEGRLACYQVLAQGGKVKGTGPANHQRATAPQPMDAADDAPCTPQVTHRIDADLWWDPAPATSGTSTLAGYRLQRQVNDARQWQAVVDVGPDVTTYTVDGVTPVVKPGNTYRYRVLALWQPVGGAVVASEAGVYGEPFPCFQVLTLPPPGLLRATPRT